MGWHFSRHLAGRFFFCMIFGVISLSASPAIQGPAAASLDARDSEISREASSAAFLRITAVGDIMVHETQLKTHWDNDAKAYLFDDDFRYIKTFLASSDLLLGNMETTLGGTSQKYSGYPVFNTPDTLAEALKRTGFDVLTTANNHCLDTNVAGLKRTVSLLQGLGFGVIGTHATTSEARFLIREVNGIKVGLTGYTYQTAPKNGLPTLNGGLMPSAAVPLIDSFSSAYLERDLASMTARARLMRQSGAELVVFFLHWGEEYGPRPTSQQWKMAHTLASAGVDLIFGSHPHVVQTAAFVPGVSQDRKTFVAFSLGNFLSNQRYEFLKRHDTEDGLVVSVCVSRPETGQPCRIDKVEYLPIWVHRHQRDSRWRYHILPLPEALQKTAEFGLDQTGNLIRAWNSLRRTQKVLQGAPDWKEQPIPGGASEPPPADDDKDGEDE